MLEPGSYSDTLRAVGRSLEDSRAIQVAIVDHGDHLEVAWRDANGQRQERRYDAPSLGELQAWAQAFRGSEGESRPSGVADFLRSLGQELDDRAVEAIAIAEVTGGLWVSWSEGGSRTSVTFTTDDLAARAIEYQAKRPAQPAGTGGLFARITPGKTAAATPGPADPSAESDRSPEATQQEK